MRKLKFALVLLVGLFVFQQSYSQLVSDTTINIHVTYEDSAIVDLAWKTPAGATKCTIVHETLLDTTTYSIPNFALDSTQLPATSPAQPWDRFTIYFELITGQTKYDHIQITVDGFGGVVIIHEDVFYKPVAVPCAIGGYEGFAFMHECVAAEAWIVCEISKEYQVTHWLDPMTPTSSDHFDNYLSQTGYELFDSAHYRRRLLDALFDKLNNGESGVYNCEEYLGISGSRKGNVTRSLPELYSCAPNPFTNKLVVRTLTQQLPDNQPIVVRDNMGRELYCDMLHDESLSISTQEWPAGMYIIQIGSGPHMHTFKSMKY